MGTARLSPDEKTIYFRAKPDGGWDHLFTATRASRDEPFGPPKPLSSLNSSLADGDPTVSGDQLRVVFSRTDPTHTATADLFIAARSKPTDPFGAPDAMVSLNGPVLDGNPFLASDGGELWFESGDVPTYHLFRALAGEHGFQDSGRIPVPSPVLGSTRETCPVLSFDGKVLFLTAQVAGKSGNDIWEARRNSIDEDFQPARHVTELSDAGSEGASWLSPDGCRLYLFHSSPAQIFMAERPRKK